MKTNTYGLTLNNLRKVSGSTANWPIHSGGYTEIFYDIATGDLWSVDQVSLGGNSYTQYDSADVVKVCDTNRHLTMQQIADLVHEAVSTRQK